MNNDEVFCIECGYSFYLLHESEFYQYNQESNKNIYKSIGHCRKCGCNNNLIDYGKSSSEKSRKKCLNCGAVFTHYSDFSDIPDNLREINDIIFFGGNISDYKISNKTSAKIISQKLKKLAMLLGRENNTINKEAIDHLDVATEVIFIPYNSSNNKLYVIVSYCMKTGRVLQITTNYFSSAPLTNEMVYNGNIPQRNACSDVAYEISNKEYEISLRRKFFEIDYGTSKLKKNELGHIVKPAYSSYRHFDILSKKLTGINSINHFIEHESFIYASCLSSFKDKVKNKSCQILYLRMGKKQNNHTNNKLILKNYWKDIWNISIINSITYATCNLTSSSNITRPINLLTKTKFTNYIYSHPFYNQLTKMSAQNATLLLDIVSAHYNKNLQ
ncbi:hypothetical protein [Vibrio sp.]|uniref:hypothetical protein n=1 Tax=Vibrio sp. TaxID=678 RepID=UPI003A8B2B66